MAVTTRSRSLISRTSTRSARRLSVPCEITTLPLKTTTWRCVSTVDGRSASTFVWVFAVDEPDFGVLPTSPPGRQVAAPSEWRLVSAFAQVLMKGGPYMGMRR